ncbi:class I glutamine amidotransferase-like protein [Pelagophyceae sp. CCMP2097]|nr:class I glutamine amidotransferase-like protein [Pelagophyceae sp. CCMP2097]
MGAVRTALLLGGAWRTARAFQRPALRGVARLTSVSAEAQKRVLVPIADGSEEIETTCISDTLVRAGAFVVVASANSDATSLIVTMSRGLKILADAHVSTLVEEEWDAVVCPGGMPGAANLRDSVPLDAILRKHCVANKLTAAVCAAPAVVLQYKGLLAGRKATCYPAPQFEGALDAVSPGDVVVDAHFVTSRGPGTSLKFAIQLVSELYGPEKAQEIAKQMLVE